MKTTKFAIFVGVVAMSVLALAQAAVEPISKGAQANSFIICKNQKNVRTIRVEKDQADNQCVAVYTKAGIDREVGRAQTVNSCFKIIENIKSNLEKADWKCKEHEKVSTTSGDSKE